MAQIIRTQIGDSPPRDVRDAHTQQQRIDIGPDRDVLGWLHLGGSEVRVDVERVDGERQHAKQVDLGLSDCFTRPVMVHITGFIVLEVTAETGLAGIKDAGQGLVRL